MESWEYWQFGCDRPERRMPWGAPKDPRNDSQPRSALHPRRASARGWAREIWQGDS
jgi:hypothetical protein